MGLTRILRRGKLDGQRQRKRSDKGRGGQKRPCECGSCETEAGDQKRQRQAGRCYAEAFKMVEVGWDLRKAGSL